MPDDDPGGSGPETRPSLRDRIDAALQASVDRCARCQACGNQVDAVLAVVAPLIPADDQVSVSREDLRMAAAIADRMNVADSDGVHAQMTVPEMAVFDRLSAAAEVTG